MSDGLCLLLLPFLAFAVRFDFELSGSNMRLYLGSFPVVLTATYISFFFIDLYRGIWRHTGLEDLGRLAKGVIGGTLLDYRCPLVFLPLQWLLARGFCFVSSVGIPSHRVP